MAYERNLVLVWTEHLQRRAEYGAIAEKIAARAPDIEVFIVNNKIPNSVSRRQAGRRPSLIFSPVPLRVLKPDRGKIYSGRHIAKMDEVRRMQAGGTPVPDAVIVEPDTRLDPTTWGPFTVLKPSRGMGGHGVRLTRTRDVRWADPQSWPRDDARFGVPLIAQKSVDTGPHTVCHKVTVFFGRPIWSTTSRQVNARTFSVDPDGSEALDVPIAANDGERTVTLNYDAEVLAFGARVQGAFPEVPVLGIDVIRDAGTGKLYALEVNAGGLTWHTSSDVGLILQRERGIDLVAQFGAHDLVADALIDVTRREAE